jgi:NAD(P)-dependent dehydrogenase (short-subunit alcohol dehydrogenase family)
MPEEKRTAFVTGASQGIGAAVALALARDGFDLAVSSTRPEKLEDVVSGIRAAGARAVPIALDVREPESIERAMAQAVADCGRLDVLVNNAGVPLRRPALDVTPAEWETVLAVNLRGAFFMSQQMGRHLVTAGKSGCIVSVASTHGLVALAQRSAYGIAKAGVMHMTRMLAIEWAAHGIRVNAVAPGRVDTPSRAGSLTEPGYRDAALGRIPLKRFGTADDVAGAVSYLASPAAAYITGQTLVLDGGLTSA